MAGRGWEEMNSDCLVNIFRHLNLDDLSVGPPFVCKPWLAASLNPLCWKVLDFQSLDFMPWSQFAKEFNIHYSPPHFSFSIFLRFAARRSHGLVTELRFHRMFIPSSDDLLFVAKECPKLKVLVLPYLSLGVAARIPAVVAQWKDLERLELGSKPSCFFEMASEINVNCKRFRMLRLRGAIQEEDALAIVTLLPKLESLDLSESYLLREQLMTILNGLKVLKRLIVRDCVGFQVDDEVVKSASGIETFEHDGSKLVDDGGYDSDECELLVIG